MRYHERLPTISPLLTRHPEARKDQIGIDAGNKALATAVKRTEEAEQKVGLMAQRDGKLLLATADGKRFEKRVKSLERALKETSGKATVFHLAR